MVLGRALVGAGIFGRDVVDLEHENEHAGLGVEHVDQVAALVLELFVVSRPDHIWWGAWLAVDFDDYARVAVLFDDARLADKVRFGVLPLINIREKLIFNNRKKRFQKKMSSFWMIIDK